MDNFCSGAFQAHDRTRNGIVYGCYCDLDSEPPGTLPDQCVIREGHKHAGCVYARGLLDKGKSKWDCPYWKPMPIAEKETVEVSFLTELHQLLAKYNATIMLSEANSTHINISIAGARRLLHAGDYLDAPDCYELLQKELGKRDA